MAVLKLLLLAMTQSGALIVRNCTKIMLPVEPGQAYQAAIRGGQYLANHVRQDGSFDYTYYPHRDESSRSQYSWLRHAGAVYAMFELYDREKDELMLSQGKLALDFLAKKIVPCKGGMCLDSLGSASVGGSGLALMALSAYQQATKDETYSNMTRQLASGILAQQREDGTFEDHDFDIKTGKMQVHRNVFGLGEALLSLIQLYKIEAERTYLDAVIKGLDVLFESADDSFLSQSTHWLAPTLRLTYDFMPDQRYLDYSMRLVHGLKLRLNSMPFCAPKPKEKCWRPNSSACFADGATASWALLQNAHKPDDASLALAVLKPWLKYVMQSHIDSEKSMLFPKPAAALGGVMSLDDNYDNYVRIDDVQHASTALLAYAEAPKLLGAC